MNIFENIENFDIKFDDVELSEEDEKLLLSYLKEVVTDLLPLRGSKMKTRLYFKKHLRAITGDSEDLHTRMDKRGDIFLSSLYSVLERYIYSFGYAINLINDELSSRPCYWLRDEHIPDSVVEFALQFDIDEVCDHIDNMGDRHDRLKYLKKKDVKLKLYNSKGLDIKWYRRVVVPFSSQLAVLIEDAKEEIEEDPEEFFDPLFDDSDAGFTERILSGEIDPADYGLRIVEETIGDMVESDDIPEFVADDKKIDEDEKSFLPFGRKATAESKRFIIQYLREHVGKNPGVEELIHVAALVYGGYILRPQFKDFKIVFPMYVGKDTLYSPYLGKKGCYLKQNRPMADDDPIVTFCAAFKKQLAEELATIDK